MLTPQHTSRCRSLAVSDGDAALAGGGSSGGGGSGGAGSGSKRRRLPTDFRPTWCLRPDGSRRPWVIPPTTGPDGKVVGAAAHGRASDPFFRQTYGGKTAEGIGVGSSAAEVRAELGPCQAVPRPSPFVAGRIVLACKPSGLTLDLSGEGGAVIALRVGAEVW